MSERCNSSLFGPNRSALRIARKLLILLLGVSVIAVGLVMLIAPGPAFIVIPSGLAILGLEFAWARNLNLRLKEEAKRALLNGKYSKEKQQNTNASD